MSGVSVLGEGGNPGPSLEGAHPLVIDAQLDAAVDGVTNGLRTEGAVEEEVGDPALGDPVSEAATIFEPALVAQGWYHGPVANDGSDYAGVAGE